MKSLAVICLWVGLGVTAHAQNCENIIYMSKTISSAVSDKSTLDQRAAAFCSDFAKKQGGNSSTNIGVSYESLKASFGQSNASMEEMASKVCSSENFSSASANAFRNYVETISDRAYDAYQQCVSMTQSDMKFNVNTAAVLPSEFSISVGYSTQGSGVNNALMAFSTSSGVTCSWGGEKDLKYKIVDRGNVLFKCSRQDQTKPSFVQIARLNGQQGTLTIPWIAYSKEGVPITTLADMQKVIDGLKVQVTSATTSISNIVSAKTVAVYQCPAGKTPGWNPGGPWGSYGCQGQISASASCSNIEFPHTDTRPCTPIGQMRMY